MSSIPGGGAVVLSKDTAEVHHLDATGKLSSLGRLPIESVKSDVLPMEIFSAYGRTLARWGKWFEHKPGEGWKVAEHIAPKLFGDGEAVVIGRDGYYYLDEQGNLISSSGHRSKATYTGLAGIHEMELVAWRDDMLVSISVSSFAEVRKQRAPQLSNVFTLGERLLIVTHESPAQYRAWLQSSVGKGALGNVHVSIGDSMASAFWCDGHLWTVGSGGPSFRGTERITKFDSQGKPTILLEANTFMRATRLNEGHFIRDVGKGLEIIPAH